MKAKTYKFVGYAKTIINQPDQAYVGKRTNWEHTENAQSIDGTKVTGLYTSGHYTKEKSTYKKPHTLFAYDFDASIPSEAVITGLEFEVRMRKADKSLDVEAPIGVFNLWQNNLVDKSLATQNVTSPNKTGWYSGAYRYVPTQKIGGAYDNVKYKISRDNLSLYNHLIRTVDAQGFGLQLRCRDTKTTGEVRIKWVKMTITYVMPQRWIFFDEMSLSEETPTEIPIDVKKRLHITSQNISLASEPNRTYVFDLPLGFELVNSIAKKGTVSWNESELEWTVSGESGVLSELYLDVVPRASGMKDLIAWRDDGEASRAYFFVNSSRIVGYDDIICTPHNLRRGEVSCIDFMVRSQFTHPNYKFGVVIPDLEDTDVVSCELIESNSSDNVGLTGYQVNGVSNRVSIDLTVPPNEEFYFAIKLCYLPRNTGEQTITANTINGINKEFQVEIAEPYEKHLSINTNDDGTCSEIIEVISNRVISQVEGDLDVIPIYTDEYDSDMYVDPSTFNLNQWKRTRYIGCVEVPYAHYEPKHTSKDKLLDEHYKNKEYIGKENAVDEDITLSIKIPRRKTPTLIGLVHIDRPIPVNLVPDAFENDPLNHRGWAEIYGIEVKPTNPLYDTCEIDLKYITHNIISRFNIYRDGAVNKFELPNVLNESLESGGDIGEFFDVTTDGSYLYDEDDINVHRNLFSFSNQQDILLRSKSPLASKCKFELYWDTVKFSELRENNITRIVRLIDDTDKTVFEYEFYDFDFSDDVYTCRVMGRLLTDKGFNPIINKDIYIHSDVEYTENENDEDYDEEDLDFYGSSTLFELDSNILTILEKGFSGYEFEEKVTLETGTYYLEVYWKNNNNDDDTGNSINYMDFEISEIAYDSKLSEYYNKLLVSPYPIPNKKIVFTREGEEGTIYYIEDDGGDYSFLLEPFYQYKCGTDLVAEGSSIFDFNNSYPIIYIQNCLIRFGINRLNGDLYLDKWDNSAKTYIRTNRFRIDKFDDAEVAVINDDIITVNVSDINITMWRGRPYVMLQHETEDIHILDKFIQAFADGIGDNILDYPVIHNLANSKNLLPECVGGTNLIKSSCITVWEDDTVLNDIGEFTLTPNKTRYYEDETGTFTLNRAFDDGTVSLVINGEVVGTNVGDTLTATLSYEGDVTVYAVYHGNDTTNMKVSNMVAVYVTPSSMETDIGDEWKLTCLTKETTMKYNQGTVDFLLTHNGVPYEGIMVEVYNPNNTWHLYSNEEGKIISPNWHVETGTHKFVATTYNEGVQLDKTCTKKLKIIKSTPQIKGTILSVKEGNRIQLRLIEEFKRNDEKVPLANVSLDIEIGGKKYVRTTNDSGYVYVKMAKKGTYTAKVKYAGEKNKYNAVTESFTIVVK